MFVERGKDICEVEWVIGFVGVWSGALGCFFEFVILGTISKKQHRVERNRWC